MELSELEINAKEESGNWFERDGASFLVCATTKPAYKEAFTRKLQKHLRERRHSNVTVEMDLKFQAELFSEHILLDWKGMTEKGKALPFSKAKAFELLANPRMKLLGWVRAWADDEALFQTALDGEGIENLKKG